MGSCLSYRYQHKSKTSGFIQVLNLVCCAHFLRQPLLRYIQVSFVATINCIIKVLFRSRKETFSFANFLIFYYLSLSCHRQKKKKKGGCSEHLYIFYKFKIPARNLLNNNRINISLILSQHSIKRKLCRHRT